MDKTAQHFSIIALSHRLTVEFTAIIWIFLAYLNMFASVCSKTFAVNLYLRKLILSTIQIFLRACFQEGIYKM